MYVNPRTGALELLHDRPPLVVKAALAPADGPPVTLTVVGLHMRSLTGVDDPVDGARVREKRRAQAEAVGRLVQREQASGVFAVLLVGDLNAFSVNDGYVDVVGAIRGAPAAPDAVVTPNADVVAPDLIEPAEALRPEDRYSYVFDGTAQPLDHALITRSLLPNVRTMRYVRVNAGAPEAWRGDFSRPERVSDHDPLLVRLAGVR
jgi:predicted extracellular nuclease